MPAYHRPAMEDSPRGLGKGPLLVAAGTVLLHAVAAGRYGVFRDELYYVACVHHLAWGYVDMPPFSIAFLALWSAVFGDGVVALRVPGILIHAGCVLLAAWLAGRLGGRGFARTLAAAAVAVLPCVLAVCGFYSMNSWDVAFWLVVACLVTRLLDGADKRLWLAGGAVAGIGLLNKYSLVWYLVGLTVGLLFSPLRRDLRTRWPWLALGLTVLLVLPHFVWQVRNGWPTLEFIDNARRYKMAALGLVGFWKEQLLMGHPLMLPLWLCGLGALLVAPGMRRYRPLGIAFVVVAVWLTLADGKPYYLGPAYPMLLVAGAVQVERWELHLRAIRAQRAVAAALLVVVIGGGLAIAPLAIAVLPVETFVAYQEALGLKPASGERSTLGVLPQHFADRFGWGGLADDVAAVVGELSADDRASCLVIASNYGEAGALEYYCRLRADAAALPPVACIHNNYHLWGPGVDDPRVVVFVGFGMRQLDGWFDEVTLARRHTADCAMPYEGDLPIWICRGWRRPLLEIWPEVGQYI